jgi:hypothetical protein
MEAPKGKADVKIEDLPPKKLGVQQDEAVKGGALASGAPTGRILLDPDIFP